jgi:DNA-binding NarL/FixJ family response regulator
MDDGEIGTVMDVEVMVGLAPVVPGVRSPQHAEVMGRIHELVGAAETWSSGLDPLGEGFPVQERGEQLGGPVVQPNPRVAVAIWQGVLAGRWSLVAQFDRDGHRYFVARKNDAAGPRVSPLSERERQIVAYASLGHSNKLIAYEFGLCSSTIAAQLTSAARKLGVSSRKVLLHAFAVLGGGAAEGGSSGTVNSPPVVRRDDPAVRVTRLLHDGQGLAVIRMTLAPKLPTSLTAAEQAVATLVIEGLSNAAIAAHRSTSVRTVANQLRSIYAKLNVGSRRQLCSRFSIK